MADTQEELGRAESGGEKEEAKMEELGCDLNKLLESKWGELEAEAVDLLQKLIRIDTQNMEEEGSETQAVLFLEKIFKDAGISYEIVEPRPGRGNIIARVPAGIKSAPDAKVETVVLNSHLDTVKAPREQWAEEGWSHDPFGGEIEESDGCLYGRGAIDMKHMAAMAVTILCFVKRSGVSLEKDLVFAGVADEERGDSAYGIKHLVQHRPELVRCDVVLSEVGGFSYFVEGRECFLVQIAEKGDTTLKITAHGTGGHGSFYHTDNPIACIGEVAHKLNSNRLPLRVVPANQTTIESFAASLPFPKSLVFRKLLSPTFSSAILNYVVPPAQREPMNAILSNTANPMMLGGGAQMNQVPTSAWVCVDGRVLPGCTTADLLADIQQLLGPHRFQSRQSSSPGGSTLPPELTIDVLSERLACFQDVSDPRCQDALKVIQDVVARRGDGASIITNMIPGGTDLAYYSLLPSKPVCLGFSPVRLPPDLNFSKLFHGINERIPVEGFKWGVRVLTDVTLRLCGAKL